MMGINGFSESQIIGLLRIAIELAGDGGCNPWTNLEETTENRCWISPLFKPCSKYERCTERQADYLDVFDAETKSIIPNPNDISKIE